MPTISIFKADLESLLDSDRKPRPLSIEDLETWLMLVKGELKGHNPDTGELRVELQDSNRPDLWCCEGIAQQIRIKRQGKLKPYPFLAKKTKAPLRLIVAPGMEQVRPYVAACAARGYRPGARGGSGRGALRRHHGRRDAAANHRRTLPVSKNLFQ